MQVLKEDTMKKIKKAAVECFMKQGYETTSMREIGKLSGVSVGNVYRYFPNKEALFDFAVEPAIAILKEGHKQQIKEKMPLLDVNFMQEQELMEQLIRIRVDSREALFLLLLRNKGTKYEHIKKIFIDIIVERSTEFIKEEFGENQTIIQGDLYMKAAAAAFVEGFCVILEEASDDYNFVRNITQFIELNIKAIARHLYNIRDNKVQFRRISDEEISKYFSDNCCVRSDHDTKGN